MNTLPDPAEQNSYLRFFYRNWRPTLLGKIWSKTVAWVSGLGLTPQVLVTLQVKSRASDRLYSTVLAAADYQGQRYLVSMLGNGSNWVLDVRAAKGKAFTKRGRLRAVVLTEIPPQKRAPILKAWCKVATSGRRHLPVMHDAPLSAFEAIAAHYPVFRIDSVAQSSSSKLGSNRETSVMAAGDRQFSVIRWLRISYWIGAVTDVLAALGMLFPGLGGMVYGLSHFEPGADYRYAMESAASLMLGWTALLLWADRAPMERRFVLVLTVFPVIAGLAASEVGAIRAGFLPLASVTPMLVGQFALSALFLGSYFRAGRAEMAQRQA